MAAKLLIVSPAFHGYYEAFRRAFDAAGFETSVVLVDHFATVAKKAWNKVAFELPERVGLNSGPARSAYVSAPVIKAFREVKPDAVIVIKGDALSDAWWAELEASGVPYVVWIYDEVRRMRFSDERLQSFPKVATYSAEDHAALSERGITSMHIANGFDSFLEYREIGHRDEVTFVGAAYDNRIEVLSAVHEAGERVRAYGRDWSHDWRDRARTWNRPRPDIPASRDVSRSDAYGIMKGSLANINIHFNQDGFAMRTFEVPGVGGVQLIDRPDVDQHFDVGTEVLVYESPEELVELSAKVRRDTAWANRIREAGQKRTLAQHTMVHRAEVMKGYLGA